jgi:hypothetical protein
MPEKTLGKGFVILAAALFVTALLMPARAGAVEVKKDINMGNGGDMAAPGQGPAPRNPLTKAQQQALQDSLANDSETFLGQESEKKSSGQAYVDLEHAKFSYMPGAGTVTAKLTAPEYQPSKSGEGKGKPTGNTKALVFKYKVDGNKLTAMGDPKWEDVGGKAK